MKIFGINWLQHVYYIDYVLCTLRWIPIEYEMEKIKMKMKCTWHKRDMWLMYNHFKICVSSMSPSVYKSIE